MILCEVFLKSAGEKEILVKIDMEMMNDYLEEMPDPWTTRDMLLVLHVALNWHCVTSSLLSQSSKGNAISNIGLDLSGVTT